MYNHSTLGTDPSIKWTGGWVCTRVGLDKVTPALLENTPQMSSLQPTTVLS
jgi:hypothetical protein